MAGMLETPASCAALQPALAGHEAVGIALALDHDRMEQPVEADRFAERREGVGLECPAGLFRVGRDRGRVQADERRRPFLGFGLVGEQGIKPAAEATATECPRRRELAHTGLGIPAADSTAPPWIRASRLALSSRYAIAPRHVGS